jgi:hypothetical protein
VEGPLQIEFLAEGGGRLGGGFRAVEFGHLVPGGPEWNLFASRICSGGRVRCRIRRRIQWFVYWGSPVAV